MGDVCGKGVEAAALTSLARYGIRAVSRDGSAPGAVLSELNDLIVQNRGLDTRFSTVACARLVVGERTIVATVASAGHPLPLIVRADGAVAPLGAPGMLLGPFARIRVSERSDELHPGDALVLYTDGVTEARRAGEMFGEERLHDVLARQAGRPAQEMAEAVESAVVGFRGGSLQDDLAVLVVRVGEAPLR
jgi:sigma-B regulation protein RsbU (phosphoserine phosphatase)